MQKKFKTLLAATKLPYAVENNELLWIGGSEEQPWIVTTMFEGILNKEWVGGKAAKQADIYRKLKGIGVVDPKVVDLIEKIKNLAIDAENQFAVTDFAYQNFVRPLMPQLKAALDRTKFNAKKTETFTLAEENCQALLKQTDFTSEFEEAIKIAFTWLDGKNPGVPRAVRSTAPSEDGGEFSGSGKYSTKLRQFGFEEVKNSIKACFVSRFNRGALHYQFMAPHAFGEDLASLSFAVMIQDMDHRIDVAGTLFTADTQSNHRGFVEINATYGLGEAVVSGRVSSDTWIFAKTPLRKNLDGLIKFKLGEKQERFDGQWKPNTTDDRNRKCMGDQIATEIATAGVYLADLFRILDPESQESDFEMAINLDTVRKIITQQRAITTLKNEPIHKKFELKGLSVDGEENDELGKYSLLKDQGINAGITGITHGVVISLFGEGPEFKANFEKLFAEKRAAIAQKFGDEVGVILVTAMTYPWMEPSMEQTVACITTRGGKNDHTPIWCKEHGLPCAVSVKEATKLPDGEMITYYGVGDMPMFYKGRQQYSLTETKLEGLKPSPVPIRLIMSDAATARIVCGQSYFPDLNIGMGSGLVRWEMIAAKLRVHPMAVINYETLEKDFIALVAKGMMTHDDALRTAKDVKEFIKSESKGFENPIDWYTKSLAKEIAGIVSPYYTDHINEPMVIRLPDFKTNEHADLLGGRAYEPIEENPMLGDRGAGKYLGDYSKAFTAMDLKALAYVINDMGYENIHIEVPFVRTPQEMQQVSAMVKAAGIHIPLDMMIELPVNISRAYDFFPVSDGGQIGSNDLLQLELGLDRSGGTITDWHVEHLKHRITKLINRRNKYQEKNNKHFHLGLCGNLPSTDPKFAKWLADSGIEEFSVTPDALIPALLGVTGEKPEGKQTITTFLSDGGVLVNGEAVLEAAK